MADPSVRALHPLDEFNHVWGETLPALREALHKRAAALAEDIENLNNERDETVRRIKAIDDAMPLGNALLPPKPVQLAGERQ